MVYPSNMTQKRAVFNALENLSLLLQVFYQGLIVSWHLETGFPKLVEFGLSLAWVVSLWGCYNSILCLCYKSGKRDFPFLIWVRRATTSYQAFPKPRWCKQPCRAKPRENLTPIQRAHVLGGTGAWRTSEVSKNVYCMVQPNTFLLTEKIH